MSNFTRHEENGLTLGWSLEKQNSFFYFGTKNIKEVDLAKYFPNYQFHKNKQVHSNLVIDAKESPQNADGLWTTEKNKALISITADCMPVLLSNGEKVLALHAGWRGVASNIVGSAFQTLTENEKKSHWIICLGPYIQKASFEIKADTLQPLTEAWEKVSSAPAPVEQINHQQWHFDLYPLLLAQLQFCFGDRLDFYHLDFNTEKNLLFHSYRRDKVNVGRNYSFVALKGS